MKSGYLVQYKTKWRLTNEIVLHQNACGTMIIIIENELRGPSSNPERSCFCIALILFGKVWIWLFSPDMDK